MTDETIFNIDLPYPGKGNRLVRVFVPTHEEGETFPVVYMTDGRNIFEEEASRFGSWLTREAVRDEYARTGRAAIIVGIDNENRWRTNELTPSSIGRLKGPLMRLLIHPEGDEFARFVVEVVKPAVEEMFPVKKGRDFTAFCGSSSGGLESFFIAMNYPKLFSAAGVFSPAFEMYTKKEFRAWLEGKTSDAMPFLYLYMGEGDAKEKSMYKSGKFAFDLLKECCPPQRLKEVIKPDQPHNEAAWRSVFPDFLSIFLSGEAGK